MIEWTIPNKAGRKVGYYITVAVSKAGRNSQGGDNPMQLCVRISVQAAKDLRLIAGDRVLLGIDRSTKQVCFKRTTDTKSSFALSGKKSATSGVLCVQCSTELPWHRALHIEKHQVHEDAGFVAIDAHSLFEGGAA